MSFLWKDYLGLIVAGVLFIVMLVGIWDVSGFLSVICGMACAYLTFVTVNDVTHRHQDRLAAHQVIAAGYHCSYVSRRHCTLMVGQCRLKFSVHRFDDGYKVAVKVKLPSGKKEWRPLRLDYQDTPCPA